ncbi:hypothetical protein GCM10009801_29770 [Streptomyces albiaxialis]|uniref:Uncharacterized protein n=1 Tax=Streptomyces albiaxialis TaxID=329523 RepID=A0ABP5HFU4_9ACTN
MHLRVNGEGRLVDVVAPFEDLAVPVDEQEIAHGDMTERDPERIDPAAVRELRVPRGDMSRDALLVPLPGEDAERRREAFLAVPPLVRGGGVAGRRREVEPLGGYGRGLGHGGLRSVGAEATSRYGN